jgi:hypothetical protein
LMAVGADAPTKILEFSANCQFFTSNALHLSKLFSFISQPNSSYTSSILV